MKADPDHEEIVVLTLSISLVLLEGVSILHVSVLGIAETKASLPEDLPYLNLNCSSNVSHSKNTYANAG